MSFFRPPAVSPLTVWAGRVTALGGIALGLAAAARGIGIPGVSEGIEALGQAAGLNELTVTSASQLISPLVLGTAGSLAVWRSAEKAGQVRRQTRGYHRGLDEALNRGQSDIALPSGMLDRRQQVSWITSTFALATGALLFIAGGFLMFSGLMGGLTSYETIFPNLAGGIALTGMGYSAWKVGTIAAEAREFAHSTEASAERGRIAEDELTRSATRVKDVAGPAPDLGPVPPPRGPVVTPLTDRFRSEQAGLAQAAHAMEQEAMRPRSFLERLRGERNASAAIQRG